MSYKDVKMVGLNSEEHYPHCLLYNVLINIPYNVMYAIIFIIQSIVQYSIQQLCARDKKENVHQG